MASPQFCSRNCFLCPGETQSGSKFSLQNILSYLKVDVAQTSYFKNPVNKPEVLVSLCKDCEIIFNKFTKHYEDLQDCKIRVESSLKDILTKLESKGAMTANFGNEEVMDELRQKVLMESKARNGFVPQVHKWDGDRDLADRKSGTTLMYDQVDEVEMEQEEGLADFLEPIPEVDSEGDTKSALDSTSNVLLLHGEGYPRNERVDKTKPVLESQKNDELHYIDTLDDYGNDSFSDIESTQERKLLWEETAKQKSRLTRSCPHCGKLLRSEALPFHLLTHHPQLLSEEEFKKIKKHECHLCSKFFRSKFDLVRHMRSHTGDRPFSCSICDKRFTRKDHLRKHVKTIHGKKSRTAIRKEQSEEKVIQSELIYHQPANQYMEMEQKDGLQGLQDPLGESDVKVEAIDEEIVKEVKNCPGIKLKVKQCQFCKGMFLLPDAIQNHLLTEHFHLLSPVEVQQMGEKLRPVLELKKTRSVLFD